MIISHKHKFIFIKTAKTAGTSVEIALSKFCGAGDIITPIKPKDEAVREELGYPGPQNYFIPFRKYTKFDWARFFFQRKRLAYFNHARASFIKQYLAPGDWGSYFKFCFERNPWDKAVSLYYWTYRKGPGPSISKFIQSGGANRCPGFELYTIHAEIVVDRVFLYERIDEAMQELAQVVGLPEVPQLPQTKGGFREDKGNYRQVLSPQDREKIAKVYAREIAYFGYEW
jgi:hypothetical protein